MAYTPKTWACDDTITADELNRMEQGIAEASQSGGGSTSQPLIVKATYTPCPAGASGPGVATLDHTWQEIKDAVYANRLVLMEAGTEGEATDLLIISSVAWDVSTPEYAITFADSYTTDSEDGYPSLSDCKSK